MRKAAAASTHTVFNPLSSVSAQTGTRVSPVIMDAELVPAPGVPPSLNIIYLSVFIYQKASVISPLHKGHWRRGLLKTEPCSLLHLSSCACITSSSS